MSSNVFIPVKPSSRPPMIAVIGDVHGCKDELVELISLLIAEHGLTSSDRVVLAGDLIDRGPDPVGVVQYARDIGAEAIIGNHDEKFLRWVKHEKVRALGGKKNPIKEKPERVAQWQALSEQEDLVAWMRTWPATLYLGDNWVAVHGGFEAVPWEKQKQDRMIRCRFLSEETGLMIGAKDGEDPWDKPSGAVHWMDRWRGKNVAYGHAVHSLSEPRVDINDGTECWGIDTGCVFGGRLTALLLPEKKIVQVRAKKQYAEPLVKLSA